MSFDPNDTRVRTCVVCQDAPVHPELIAHCAPCHVQFLCDVWADDDHIAASAEDLGVELVTIEVEAPSTSSGEFTLDIGDFVTVDQDGNEVLVGT
jgi:hypothetical protein